MKPRVTIFIPCYNLGHLLAECVDSVRAQTFTDFELLIMDDCSPDDTPQVARSFLHDRRVRHVRNEPNLGHLRNFNKAIAMARGDYVWLLSADDRLRSPHVMQRFVETMDAHPKAGYVFCPAVKFSDRGELGVYGAHGPWDCIFPGRDFLKTLVEGNSVCAPAAMARKECYERITDFPLDLPFSGDWYIWAMFAAYHDVAYLAEPMVYYQVHEKNMTRDFLDRRSKALMENDIAIPWRIKDDAERRGDREIASICWTILVGWYALWAAKGAAGDRAWGLTIEEIDESVDRNKARPGERRAIRARALAAAADGFVETHERSLARRHYVRSLLANPFAPRVWAKCALSVLGRPGEVMRARIGPLRRWIRGSGRARALGNA